MMAITTVDYDDNRVIAASHFFRRFLMSIKAAGLRLRKFSVVALIPLGQHDLSGKRVDTVHLRLFSLALVIVIL